MSVIKSTMGCATTGISAVTNLFSAAAKATHALDTLAGVADTKATNFADIIGIKDQMIYNEAKSQLDAQLAALASSTKPKK